MGRDVGCGGKGKVRDGEKFEWREIWDMGDRREKWEVGDSKWDEGDLLSCEVEDSDIRNRWKIEVVG